jgi:hypothetical protein
VKTRTVGSLDPPVRTALGREGGGGCRRGRPLRGSRTVVKAVVKTELGGEAEPFVIRRRTSRNIDPLALRCESVRGWDLGDFEPCQ